MLDALTRRRWIGSAAAGLALAPAATLAARPAPTDEPPASPAPSFLYCLNTSTIMGQKVPLAEEVGIVAEAGYDAIEPWVRELEAHVEAGGSLADVRKQITDGGLVVPSAIGFFEWVVDDDERRKKGLEDARRAMDLVRQVGGTRLAAPAVGATDVGGLSLDAIGERYRDLMAIGRELGVTPEIEVWGFSKTLTRLADAAHVAIAAGEPGAAVLADVYHLHKGRSALAGLELLRAENVPVFHMNDYPADPPPEQITDAHRVYPGDGVAPFGQILGALRSIGFRGVLSLELFNRDYWQQDPREVARTGLAKMKAVVEGAA